MYHRHMSTSIYIYYIRIYIYTHTIIYIYKYIHMYIIYIYNYMCSLHMYWLNFKHFNWTFCESAERQRVGKAHSPANVPNSTCSRLPCAFWGPKWEPIFGTPKSPRFILVQILCSYHFILVRWCSMYLDLSLFCTHFCSELTLLQIHPQSVGVGDVPNASNHGLQGNKKKRWIGSQTNSKERPNLLKSRKTSLLLEEPTATCPWTHHPGHSWHFAPLEIAQAFAPKASCESEHPTWIKADISRTEIYKSVHQRV